MSEIGVENKGFEPQLYCKSIVTEGEYSLTVIGTKEFCAKVSEYVRFLRFLMGDK